MAVVEVPHVLDLTGSGGNVLLQSVDSGCHILNSVGVLLSMGIYAMDSREHSSDLDKECRGKYVGISCPSVVVADTMAKQTAV